MKFKGDIIITDPCYIMKKDKSEVDLSSMPNQSDYVTCTIEKDARLFFEQLKAYLEVFGEWEANNNQDDWEKCNYGSDMEVLGFTNYMTEDTRYGDWSCHTFNSDTKEPIGQFCADAGMVSVFLLEEVLAYNPDFDYHMNRPHTTTLIKDFDGEVKILYFDKIDEVRVIGKGNINFETHQTGF